MWNGMVNVKKQSEVKIEHVNWWNKVLKYKVIKWKLGMGDGMVSVKIAEWTPPTMIEN